MKQKEKAPAAAGTVTSAKENKTQEQDNRSARNCKARILQETIEQIRRHECRNGLPLAGSGKARRESGYALSEPLRRHCRVRFFSVVVCRDRERHAGNYGCGD